MKKLFYFIFIYNFYLQAQEPNYFNQENLTILQKILADEPNVKITGLQDGNTALHIYILLSASHNNIKNEALFHKIISRLTAINALNTKNNQQVTALALAFQGIRTHILTTLLDQTSLSITQIDADKDALELYTTHNCNDSAILKKILTKCAAINHRSEILLDVYLKNKVHDPRLLDTLIQATPNINAFNKDGFSPLAIAFIKQYLTAIKKLLDHPEIKTTTLDIVHNSALDHYEQNCINNHVILEAILEKQTNITVSQPPLYSSTALRLLHYGMPGFAYPPVKILQINTGNLKKLLHYGCTVTISAHELPHYAQQHACYENIKTLIAYNQIQDSQEIASLEPHAIPSAYSSCISPLTLLRLWISKGENKRFMHYATIHLMSHSFEDTFALLCHAYATKNKEMYTFLHYYITVSQENTARLENFIIDTLACPEYLPNPNYETVAKHALATRNEHLFDKVRHHCGLPPVKMYTHPYAAYNCRTYPLDDLLKKIHLFQKNMLPHTAKFCDLIIEHKH